VSKSETRIERRFRIDVLTHRESDLLVAVSDDLPGLMVQARSQAELHARIAPAIRELLEAQGNQVLNVETDGNALAVAPSAFLSHRLLASARMLGSA
jgi:hypothetical protein